MFDVLEWWAGVLCANPLARMFFSVTSSVVASLDSSSFSTRTKSVSSSSVRRQARQARQARSQVCVSSFERQLVPCTSPSHRVHLVTDLFDRLSSSHSTNGTRGYMNSCGSLRGGGVHVNSLGNVHLNSRGAMEHRNSCNLHAAGVRGGTLALSMSTWRGVRCSVVDVRRGQAFCVTRVRGGGLSLNGNCIATSRCDPNRGQRGKATLFLFFFYFFERSDGRW